MDGTSRRAARDAVASAANRARTEDELRAEGSFRGATRFLAVRYEGNPARTRVELGLALAAVHEWFPVRTLVADMLQRAGLEAADALDSWSALVLAEQLDVALLRAGWVDRRGQ